MRAPVLRIETTRFPVGLERTIAVSEPPAGNAETDVRVLRLTRANLERLRRRYPRTGAQIYANLSVILADRVATTTKSLS